MISTAILTDVPAIVSMATLGTGFGVWRNETRDGKPTKVPYQTNGARAKSNDPTTWGPLAEALTAVGRLRADGVGVLLRQLPDSRWLVGIDLDLCRSPVTGRLEPWARRIVDRFGTYCEISPSGTGVKLFGIVTTLPAAMTDGGRTKGLKIVPPGATMPEGAEGKGHEAAEIAMFPGGRYFTVTGQRLDGAPDDIADITGPFAELAHELAGMGRSSHGLLPVPVDLAGLPDRLREAIAADRKLAESWSTRAKLTGGGTAARAASTSR